MATTLIQQTALKQYFTDALEVNSAMTQLLGNVEGLTLLEPSVGNGALLNGLQGSPRHIDAIDVDPAVLALTRQRYADMALNTHHADFIDLFADGFMLADLNHLRRDYDAVISNPPFGLFFSTGYRKRLKSLFPNLYVRESYGLFFAFSLMLLRNNGRYVFLLPDTFLTSRNHSSLRRYIFSTGAPSHIIRFPSRRFETVNFGYGNLCIIAGNKRPTSPQTSLIWIEAFDDRLPLMAQPDGAMFSLSGTDLQNFIDAGWRASMCEVRSDTDGWTRLGEVADCKTGIYTGDNGRFIGFDAARINKRLNGHSISWEQVCVDELSASERQHGLAGARTYVPLIRGGHRLFAEKTAWAIRWDKEALEFYKNDKKARLQNSSYYFKPGIAVPMVTSRRISASLMDNAVFDQGVVGVFPFDSEARYAFLLYLNSSIATELRNEMVNGSANNSANYLKRLPIPVFTKADFAEATRIVAVAREKGALETETCDLFVGRHLTKQDRPSGRLAAT
ncbi:Eco57I restriction-modification methylase domain-containing protein [Teichococcus vastitatis]|uniref:Eco57I restriction-modification methylase domain-containing protein n=1 Tax=Teichococcus vastitatis TaxID=2307076 RepID=UPI000E707433|nr:N-6 DNA methylase [Pseudoroseomonas vastitatis]